MRPNTSLRQLEAVKKTKHSWIQTGNIKESKCVKCGVIRKITSQWKYYFLNNIEIVQEGCSNINKL